MIGIIKNSASSSAATVDVVESFVTEEFVYDGLVEDFEASNTIKKVTGLIINETPVRVSLVEFEVATFTVDYPMFQNDVISITYIK